MISKIAIFVLPFLFSVPTIAVPKATLELYTSTSSCEESGTYQSTILNENECFDFENSTVASAAFSTLSDYQDVLACYGYVYENPGCVGQSSQMRTGPIQSSGVPFVCASGGLLWSDGGKNISSALFTCLDPTSSC